MFAPNLVYATVAGRFPRLLADDGIHEPLILPYDFNSDVPFEFYREGSRTPLTFDSLKAKYIRPDGTIVELQFEAPNLIRFPASEPAGGLCVIEVAVLNEPFYQCYPFRVLRPRGGEAR